MSYLLDTCVLSELRKTVPSHVKSWFEQKKQNQFYISVVTVAELLDGIERLPTSKKKSDLEDWFYGDIQERFGERIIDIDQQVAKEWAFMNAALQKKGITIGVQDLYIAASAKVHGFALISLNVKDFLPIEIPLINPWKS